MKRISIFLVSILFSVILFGCGDANFDQSDPRAEYGWTKKEYESIVTGISFGAMKISNKYGAQIGETYRTTVSSQVKGMSYNAALNYVYATRSETMARLANTYGH